jgi:fluoroacetyl-CoA thioesterase
MSGELKEGLSHTVERLVEEKYCTQRAGQYIFSTPNLVLLIEETAIQTIAPLLREGQACVGSMINITHGAPTLRGQRVWATTTVTTVDRRRVVFDVQARDEFDVISSGRHERFIVDLGKFAVRLAEKAVKIGGAPGASS